MSRALKENHGTETGALRRTLSGWCLVVLMLSGCDKGIDDLQRYVADVKARKPGTVESIPAPQPYRKYEYDETGLRDPFDSSVIASAVVETRRPSGTGIVPDQNRTAEYLESFPLDTLRMVGTLEQYDTLWALVKTPDSTIQRVTLGNHMGQNYGKIERVSHTEIALTEIVPDGFGGWRKRETVVAISQ